MLQPAAEHLQRTADHLERAKTQYESAKAVHQSAKAAYDALEKSQSIRVSGSAKDLCDWCAAISIKEIFSKAQAQKSQRKRVGDVIHAIERQSFCRFCRFLLEAWQLGAEQFSGRPPAATISRQTTLYFASDPDGKPWYNAAGIASQLHPCPFVWLQTGPPTATGLPHICISFKPSTQRDDIAESGPNLAYPRVREPLEAFNGTLNYDLVKAWVERCRTHHGLECDRYRRDVSTDLELTVIEVETRRLIRWHPENRFVALSYVWGKSWGSRLECSTSTLTAPPTREETSLLDATTERWLPSKIPRTIEDAISFVRAMGEQYLWVDLYCLDQMDQDRLQTQINAMDQIFSLAHLTLVALDSKDADWGLWGVSRPLQHLRQPSMTTSAGTLVATYVHSYWHNNGSSIWNTRAWMLQERLLSSRTILFTKSNIAMSCLRGYFHDILELSPTSEYWLGDDFYGEDGSDLHLDTSTWDFKLWDSLVSAYSGRNLTFASNALNACRGSLDRISRHTGHEFCFGIPKQDFHRGLLWKGHHDHQLHRRPEFPSWSWLGWSGRVECAYWIGDMDDYADKDPWSENGANEPPPKRWRVKYSQDGWHPEKAEIKSFPNEDDSPAKLQLRTTIATFRVRLMRRHGTIYKKKVNFGSAPSNVSLGDQWTFFDPIDGQPLMQLAGEHQLFVSTDSFCRL